MQAHFRSSGSTCCRSFTVRNGCAACPSLTCADLYRCASLTTRPRLSPQTHPVRLRRLRASADRAARSLRKTPRRTDDDRSDAGRPDTTVCLASYTSTDSTCALQIAAPADCQIGLRPVSFRRYSNSDSETTVWGQSRTQHIASPRYGLRTPSVRIMCRRHAHADGNC